MHDLKAAVASARVVKLSNANFYIFLSNEADLIRELPPFLKELH
jgi:hypothetical protein